MVLCQTIFCTIYPTEHIRVFFHRQCKPSSDPSCAVRSESSLSVVNPLYTGRLFHCYMLDEFICHLGVSGLFCHFYAIFDGEIC